MMSKPTLGYWDIRGLAQPIRYILKYAGVDFTDKRYQFGEGKTFAEFENAKKPWTNGDKHNLGLDFPNLPYYLDGDIKISQTYAILRHVGRKYGLVVRDEKSLARQDMIEQQLEELRLKYFIRVIAFSPDYEKAKSEFIKITLPEQLGILSKFLGEHEWFTGNQLTYVDFVAYELLDWLRLFSPGCLSAFPNLSQFMEKFENIPQIAAYRSSSEFKNWPIIGPIATWGHFK